MHVIILGQPLKYILIRGNKNRILRNIHLIQKKVREKKKMPPSSLTTTKMGYLENLVLLQNFKSYSITDQNKENKKKERERGREPWVAKPVGKMLMNEKV